MTPSALDYLASYEDGIDYCDFQIGYIGNPAAGTATATASLYFPAAAEAEAADVDHNGTRPQSFISYANNVLSYDMNRPIGPRHHGRGRGSWKLLALYSSDDGGVTKRNPLVADTTVYAQFEVTEPLLLSPFVFGATDGKQGFYGIQSMNFTMNMMSTANRAWRSCCFGAYTKNAYIHNFGESTNLYLFNTTPI
jgi:hypothetical protein